MIKNPNLHERSPEQKDSLIIDLVVKVAGWRNREAHREAQSQGRNVVFEDYRLRIAGVIRDYGLTERAQAPSDSRSMHG
ncbi:hypothetical protein [Undibacterium parvum]|uniref:hypothetical protein n=1 Tax=Undibacterium parvum TaxID=401471 RepID=UPI00187F796E